MPRVDHSSGISIFMFFGTICALTHNRHMHDIDRPSLVVAVLLLILSTAVSDPRF